MNGVRTTILWNNVCKRYYLKGRGLEIHQKKSGCYSKLRDSHRKSCKSAAAVIQDSNHSDNSSQVDPPKVKTAKNTIGGRDKAEEDKERKEISFEEEIKIQEEDLEEEVRGWIEESQGIKETEDDKKGTAEEPQRERDSAKGGDIRNWLGVNQHTQEEEKRVKTEDLNEDDKLSNPTRRVVIESTERKERMQKKRGGARSCRKVGKTEDLRSWLMSTQKHEADEREVKVKGGHDKVSGQNMARTRFLQ